MAIPQTAPLVLAIDNALTLLFCVIAIPLVGRLLLLERINSKRLVIAAFSGPLAIYLAVHLACSLLVIPDTVEILAGLAGANFSDSITGFWFSWLCFWQLDSLALVSMTSFFLTAERLAAIVFKRESLIWGLGSVSQPLHSDHYSSRSRRGIVIVEFLLLLAVFLFNAVMTLFWPGPLCCDDAGEIYVRPGQSGMQWGFPHKAEEREAQCCTCSACHGI